MATCHDDVTKWKHFPRHWAFVRGIHRWPVNSHHKGQWRGALMFSLICAWKNCWVNDHEAGDLRRHRTPCDVTVMPYSFTFCQSRESWARLAQADTNQEFPSSPSLRSSHVTPSTTSFGTLHNSWNWIRKSYHWMQQNRYDLFLPWPGWWRTPDPFSICS